MAARKKASTLISEYENINKFLNQQLDLSKQANNIDEQKLILSEINIEKQKIINGLKERFVDLTKEERDFLNKTILEKQKEIQLEKELNNTLNKGVKLRQLGVDLAKNLGVQIKEGWKYLQLQDKVIKSTILNLGLSGVKANNMRLSFEDSISAISMLGGNIEDIATIQTTFANETGKARALTSEMVVDIEEIARGTGISVEEASKLGAQFEFMGIDAVNTNKQIQGIVDTSERMGVNIQKVIKNINENFKRINTYNFKGGINAIAKMSMTGEKFRVSMTSALDVSDKMKTLEGAIDAVAHLQVLGGEFAKVDMFQSLYMSRNEPDKWNEKISEMTRGMATFRKNSEGVFQTFISAEDRQRLELASKSLGISNEELTQIAQKRAELDLSDRQLAGKGLTSKQKEWIQGAMKLNTETGKLQVNIGGQMQDIASLTATQASAFEEEQKTLKKRAQEAQTFDEAFKNTVNAMKGALLPLLNTINKVLAVAYKYVFEPLSKLSMGSTIAAFIAFGAAATVFKTGVSALSNVTSEWVKRGVTNIFGSKGGVEKNIPLRDSSGKFISKKAAGTNAGKGLMRGGAGIGAAALGVGAGIGAAAGGISLLADSMAKLTPEQAKTLQSIVSSIGWFVVGGVAAALGITLIGKSAELSAGGLGMLSLVAISIGAAMVGVGFGIKLASDGLANLVASSKGAGNDMLKVAGGIAAIGASLSLFGLAGGLGFGVFAATMATIALSTSSLVKIGTAFEKIGTTAIQLKGMKEDFIAVQNAVESISKINTKGGGMLAELATLLKSPLKVEFVEGKIGMVNDITLNIDGEKFMQKTYDVNLAIKKHEAARHGIASKK